MTIRRAGGGRRQNAPPGPVLHPRIISSSTPESSTLTTIEPRHPRRFENRKNIQPVTSSLNQRLARRRGSGATEARRTETQDTATQNRAGTQTPTVVVAQTWTGQLIALVNHSQ